MEQHTGKPKMFAISTCPRCRRVKQYLNSRGIDYDVVDVDLLPVEERSEVLADLRKLVPALAFPVILMEKRILYGTDVTEVGEAFGEKQ